MPFAFGARSRSFMARVHPKLVAVAVLGLARSTVDFGCTEEQVRTLQEQAAKVAAGVSKTMHSRHLMRADGYGHAIDLVPWVDGAFQWGDDHWRVKTGDGRTLEPFYDIAAAMRSASIELATPLIWGAVWDRRLQDLPADPAGLKAAVEAYKARHAGPDLLDGPHFQMVD